MTARPTFKLNLLSLDDALSVVRRLWPNVPSHESAFGKAITTGECAQAVRANRSEQNKLRRVVILQAEPPILACLCPTALTAADFRTVWKRLVAEGEGTAAWAVEWLLGQATDEQRAALTVADYLACFASPAADVRLLGQRFVDGTYILPECLPVTTRERLASELAGAASGNVTAAAPPAATERICAACGLGEGLHRSYHEHVFTPARAPLMSPPDISTSENRRPDRLR